MNSNNARAAQLLRLAAQYIRENCPDELIEYDEAECDGECLALDCESAADALT